MNTNLKLLFPNSVIASIRQSPAFESLWDVWRVGDKSFTSWEPITTLWTTHITNKVYKYELPRT